MSQVYIIIASIYLLAQSATPADILNNTLSGLILDQLDNMWGILLFNWLRSNYNMVSNSPNFMIVKSSPKIETVITPIYFYSTFQFYYAIYSAFFN